MNDVLMLIFLTLLPFLELRASIPYGIFATDIHWLAVFFVCVMVNIILGPIIYLLLKKFVGIATRIKIIDALYKKSVERTQKKVRKAVDKWGELGIAIFIGIPLPGSGVYSGALAAYIIGLNFKKFIIATVIGVLIAGILVTIASLTGIEAFRLFIKTI